MLTPRARGALSEAALEALRTGLDDDRREWPAPESPEDAAITLWALYELHYHGFADLHDADLEWHPELIRLRRGLERDLERRLRARHAAYTEARRPDGDGPGPGAGAPGDGGADLAERLFDYVAAHDGVSVALHVQRHADREQVLELLRLRSIYHLKEADPTAWVVPRLPVGPKAALMELQYDEYGVGDPNRLHSHLWALGMAALGLDADYGAHVDEAPLAVLEQNNAMSFLGLHRRLRGAALGHLAAFEATSSLPSRRMAQGLERLELPAAMVAYYTEHVEADAVHEQLAARTICGRLVELEPELAADVFFGAFTCLDLEDRFARWMLGRWGVLADPGDPADRDGPVVQGSAA